MTERSDAPADEVDPNSLEYVEVIARDRVAKWEAGDRIASSGTATCDEYRLAKAYLARLSETATSRCVVCGEANPDKIDGAMCTFPKCPGKASRCVVDAPVVDPLRWTMHLIFDGGIVKTVSGVYDLANLERTHERPLP